MDHKYVKKKKIGEGSFGKALLVVSKADGKEYVIKEINISKMKRKEREESKKEVSVLKKMRHPNIVSYQESFEAEGNLYIVMDYCDGGDLYKAINGRRGILFPEEQIVDWFVQICLALKHVHDRKILHRDLKSQNIFLTKKGIIKLGDFGIARVLNSTSELARTCIGTPYYLSPEICENKPYNNKSDIWALGCVLYELCTLKHAFEAGNMKNLVLKIIRGSYPPLSPRYTYDLRTLQNQLFKRSPRERPSVNTILKKPFIQKRIEKFLSETQVSDEFSHTVLHRNAPAAKAGGIGRPVVSAANKKPSPYQPARVSNPAAKYGPSVARKAPAAAAKRSADREKKGPDSKELERKKKELMDKEQERRNREIHMRQQQQRLVEKQRMHHMNKAREVGWKNTLLGSDEANENDKASDEPPKKEARMEAQDGAKPLRERGNYEQYNNYLDKLQANQKQAKPGPGGHIAFRKDAEDAAIRQRIAERPVSASAAEAAKRGEDGRMRGAEAAERAKIVEEFLSRKRQAAAYKDRGAAPWMGAPAQRQQSPPPAEVLLPYGGGPGGAMRNKHGEEQEYLDRLKAIRMQNFQERRNLQQKVAAGGKAVRPTVLKTTGRRWASLEGQDPKSNAEARRKKIEALKAQADEKAAKLKEQLEKQRRDAYEKEKKQWEEHLARKQRGKQREPKQVKPKGPAARVIGLTGVLHDVGIEVPSAIQIEEPSKPDISTNAITSEPEAQKDPENDANDRRKWIGGETAVERLGNMPIQADTVPVQMDTVIFRGKQEVADRKHWKGGETAANKLSNLPLQENTSQEVADRKHWKGGETAANKLSNLPLQENTSQIPLDRRKWTGGETALNKLANLPVQENTGNSEIDRKKWAGGDTALSNLGKMPLQETASAMEATSAQDVVIRGAGPAIGGAIPAANGDGGRKKWGGHGTAVVSALGKVDLASETITLSKNEPKAPMGITIVKSDDKKTPPRKLPIAKGTITISKPDDAKSTDDTDGGDIETIETDDGKADEVKERLGTIGESTEPKTAWDNKSPRPPKSPKSPTGSSSSLDVNEETVIRARSPRSPRRRRELTKSEKKQNGESCEETLKKEDEKTPKKIDEKTPKKEEEKMPKKEETCETKEDGKSKEKTPEKQTDEEQDKSQEQVPTKEKALIGKVDFQDEEEEEQEPGTDDKDDSEEGGLFVGLTTGNFDTDARILRSCSLPDLSKLFRTTLALNPFFEVEQQTMAAAATTLNLNLELEDLEDEDQENDVGEDDFDGGGDEDNVVENGDDEEEQDQSGDVEDDDEDDEDYQSFVESLKHVLEAADKGDDEEAMENDSPSPKSLSPTGAEGGEDDEDDEDGVGSKPINEDWDSGEGDGSDDENQNQDDDDTESVYCRLEESRLQLEEELGCDDFLKAYKTVQAIHEDEDENIDEGTKIVGNILGEQKQHLYTKILQLVMADGAYTEDND
ncbi:serine/threonine-protein kinase Nek1-like isoform X1 [Amphiura filiformis]|uniref:serine/threonine-protein kinase Nek1-like isoform X1 n=1 Tax=Amphiura filiformis TaxID=82378 RepID=UPI003B216E6D